MAQRLGVSVYGLKRISRKVMETCTGFAVHLATREGKKEEEAPLIDYKIYTGGRAAIATGSVIAYEGAPIEIRFTFDESKFLRLIFNFHDDGSGPEGRVEVKILAETHVELNLYNFTNPLGDGTKRPIEIGQLNGRPLSLHFRVYHLPDADKTLQFSIFHKMISAPTGLRIS